QKSTPAWRPVRLSRRRSQYLVALSAILFRYAPDDSRANNSIRTARPHSQTSLLRILAMPNRRCKFATIYCARSLEIPFLSRAHRRDLEADCPYYCGQKMSRAADRRPRARPKAWLLPPAAESLYVTEARKFLVDFP